MKILLVVQCEMFQLLHTVNPVTSQQSSTFNCVLVGDFDDSKSSLLRALTSADPDNFPCVCVLLNFSVFSIFELAPYHRR